MNPVRISIRAVMLNLLGSAILAFGLYNVHAFSVVTEGGMLGITLFLHHWFGISPSVSGLVINAACYLAGWRTLGRMFIVYSIIAGGGFSLFYALFEQFPQIWPQLAHMPLTAAVVGALAVRDAFDFKVLQKGGTATTFNTEDVAIEPRSGRGQPYVVVVLDDVVTELVRA